MNSAPSPAIDIKHATLTLEGHEILHDLSWQVNRGEHWFILGPNGAGKTTLVKMILGLIWPRFGAQVSVLGNRYGQSNLFEVRKKIAWASPFMNAWTSETQQAQLTFLDVVLSGLESTIGFYRAATPEELTKADRILELLDSSRLRDAPFARLSSGEQVKALIGRTLIADPELLILDETCVHLDLQSREILLDSIDSIARRNPETTMLFVTQRIEEITDTFDKGLILGGGQIVMQGSRETILTTENLKKAYGGMELQLMPGPKNRLWPLPKA